MTRRLPLLALLTLALGTPACRREPAPAAPQPSTTVTASDPDAKVGLTITLDHDQLRTVDRAELTITTVRPAGLRLTLAEPDWSQTQWTRVDATDTRPTVLPDGRLTRSRTITLEPFLEGDYTVPPVTLAWGTGDAARTLASAALKAKVTSVLPQDDGGQLAAPAPALAPTEPEPASPGLITVAAVVAIAALLLTWRFTRPRHHHDEPAPDPVETLRAAAATTETTPETLPAVHHAIAALAPQQPSLSPLVARCERARFEPGAQGDAGDIAREALRLIGGAA